MNLSSIDSGIFSLENSELVGKQEETKEANQQSKLSPVTESPQDQSFLIEGFPTKEDEISPENSYNILLLGETGVGKTTFINAGANYTAFDSMKEALEMGPIIPMDISFTSTRGMQLFPVKIPSSVSNGDLYSSNECDQPGLSKTQTKNQRREAELQKLEMASIEIKRKMLELKKEIEEIERKIEKVVECAAELTASVANTLMFEYFNEQLENLITKEKKEPPFSFFKDESTDIIAAIHSIVLIKEMHWTQKQTIIRFILGPRENAYFTWIENLKEFPEDLSAVLSKEQIMLVNICVDWNDERLQAITVKECPEWQAAFKDWKERRDMDPTSHKYMNWAYGLARCYNSGNITTRNSNAKEEKQQYYQETCLCKLHNNNCRRCRTPSAAERFKRQNGTLHPAPTGGIASPTEEKAYQSLPQEAGYVIINHLDKQTQGEPSSFDNTKVADDDDPDMRDMSILAIPVNQENELNVREGEQPTSFIDINRQQTAFNYGTTSQNRTQDAQQTPYFEVEGSNDFDRYGISLTLPRAQLEQQHYGGNKDTSPPRGSGIVLDAAYLLSAGQQKEKSLPNWSKGKLGSRTLFSNYDEVHDANDQEGSREQSEFAHVQQRSTSCTSDSLETDYSLVPKSVEIQPAGEESLDKTNEQERNKDRAQVSVESFQQKESMVQESSISQEEQNLVAQGVQPNSVQMENSTKQSSALEEGSDQKSQEEPRMTTTDPVATKKESFVSQEEQSSIAQGVQPENKEESAQSNRNKIAEDKNSNFVQMSSTKQLSVLEEGSDQKNQEKPKITTTDPAVTKKVAKENNISHESENNKENKQINTQSKIIKKEKKCSSNPTHNAENSPNNGQRRPSSYSNKLTERVAGTPGKTRPAQSCSTGRFEENAQKSPRALAMANSKRPPLQPFPRIANKKAEISHYSPSINLTNQEGIAVYNLILVGDSNVGKTTLFNSSANYLLSESEAEAFGNPMFLSDVSFRVTENSRSELISVQANFKSEDGLAENSSQYPFMEEITYYDPESGKMKMLRILDTPGINDEKGAINVENILKAAKLMGEIHGIGILIGANEVRTNFTLVLNRLLRQFHKSAIKNLLFFYTKVSGPTYAPGDGYPLVENYLKAAKIDLPLNLENVFCFDNRWFRSLCIEQFNSKNGKMYEVPTRTGWSHSKNEMERLMKRLSKSKEPYKMEESVFLDETKRFLEELAEPVSQCLLKYIEKSYEIEGIAKDRDQPQLMVNGVKEEAELKKTFDKILKKCSQLAAFLQKNTIVPGVDPFLEHFTSLRDIEKEKDEFYRVKSHHLPKLRSTCEKYVAELNNAINDVKKPNIEGIKTELVGMTHFNEIFYNAFGGKMKF